MQCAQWGGCTELVPLYSVHPKVVVEGTPRRIECVAFAGHKSSCTTIDGAVAFPESQTMAWATFVPSAEVLNCPSEFQDQGHRGRHMMKTEQHNMNHDEGC